VVPLRVGVLGPVTVWRDGREHAAGQPRQLAVLGVLATRANRVVSRGELIDAVWGDKPPASAEGGIYTYVSGLRLVLEPERPRRDPDRARRAPSRMLISGGGGYLLRLGSGALDAEHFRWCLGAARGLRAAGDLDGAARTVDEALALWRGLPYAGVPGPFAETERQRLTELRTTAVEERADLLLAQGQAAAAAPELAALAAAHPLRERATGLLMIALYRCGRQAEALRVFGETRRRLADELGVDPGSELTRIYQQLLAMDPALDGPRAEAGLAAAQPSSVPHDRAPVPATDPAPVAAACPAQLPPEVAGFAGRAAELRWLHGLLPEVGPVALITGTAGVGKTSLAIRFARQAASRFPDGQLYVNLRGFDPASAPVPPGIALSGFFDALGVPPRHVPVGLDAQSGLLRTLLDGKRVLLLLDNAHDADQVRPMLPGSSGCLVLLTSRSQLTGLVVADGARLLPLGVLDGGEAASLLAGRLGSARVSAEPDAVAALVGRAAGLPLALSVTCARAASRPGALLAHLAAELADARDRLDALQTGDATTDLRAVFSWSVDKLSAAAARAFRLLSLHPGPDISAPAAASLIAAALPQTRAALAELVRASLLTEDAAGRFGYHDLLRAYAAELSAATDRDADRDAALHRILDHYLRTAQAAAARLFPARSRLRLPPGQPGVIAEEFETAPASHDGAGPDTGSYDAALAWFRAEQRVLSGVLELAVAHGHDEHCWKLAWFWAPKLKRRGRMHEVLQVQRTALASAGRLGDAEALAHVHYDLGHASDWLGDYPAADLHLRRALELFTGLGDRTGVGQTQHGLALLLAGQDRYAEALEHAYEGLRLRRAFADSAAVASSENAAGWILAHLGRCDDALLHCRRALELHRESGNRSGTADTLDSIAFAYTEFGDHARAIDHYEQALVVYRQIGDSGAEALSLLNLGDAQIAGGRAEAARRSWERALGLLADIPGADAGAASDRLARLSAGPAERLKRSPELGLNDAVKLLSVIRYVSWGRGANAGHAQARVAAGEHSPGRDGSTN
jgi:DNA-binding SARP family transcriptional activator/tetratricopeptide (TPR) repeat protein